MARPKPKRDEGYNILGMPLKPGERDSPSGKTKLTQTRKMTTTKRRITRGKSAKAPGQMKKVIGIKSAKTLTPSGGKTGMTKNPAPKINKRSPGKVPSKMPGGDVRMTLPGAISEPHKMEANFKNTPGTTTSGKIERPKRKPMPKLPQRTSQRLGMK